jgi:hypothetical protein
MWKVFGADGPDGVMAGIPLKGRKRSWAREVMGVGGGERFAARRGFYESPWVVKRI